MSDNSPIAGWNSTDDEVHVPVRSNGQAVQSDATAKPAVSTSGPAQDIATAPLQDITIRHDAHGAQPNPRAMTMSAVLGVLLAVGGITAYLGLDIGSLNLTGDILGGSSPVTVTIGTDSTFSPDRVEIHKGQEVTLKNDNPDPQVIKSKDSRELFPVQVLFDEPYTFTVPEEATGEYVYFSETLPEDRTVTFVVTDAPQASSEASSKSVSADAIPLPFGGGPAVVPQTTSSVTSLRPAAPAVVHSDETATISLGGSQEDNSSVVSDASALPVNPYTVENGLSQETSIQQITSSAASQEQLHSGANLRQLVTHTPTAVASTGPADFLLFFLTIPSLFGVMVLARKMA